MRCGAQTLLMLATPLNGPLLHALSAGARQQAELRHAAGQPAQTTLRAQLRRLGEAGVLEKRRRNRFPGVLEYELTAGGNELLEVMATLDRWLERCPEGTTEPGSAAARAAVKALTEGWSTAMLRALAARSLTLTELDRVIAAINYPSLERRLGAMRLAELVEAQPGNGRGTPYAVTEWGRLGIGPLIAAARWELQHTPAESPAPTKLDLEAAFLLAIDLVPLPAEAEGSCRLAVELRDGRGRRRLAGILVEARDGRLVSRTTRLEGHPEAWVLGSLPAWLAAMIEGDRDRLELGGDCALGSVLVDGLHTALFSSRVAGAG